MESSLATRNQAAPEGMLTAASKLSRSRIMTLVRDFLEFPAAIRQSPTLESPFQLIQSRVVPGSTRSAIIETFSFGIPDQLWR